MQQGEVPQEQLQALGQAGGQPALQGGSGGHQVDHESAPSPWGKGGVLGHVRSGGPAPPPPLSTGEMGPALGATGDGPAKGREDDEGSVELGGLQQSSRNPQFTARVVREVAAPPS